MRTRNWTRRTSKAFAPISHAPSAPNWSASWSNGANSRRPRIPAPDVIRIDASVKDLDLVAPDAGKGPAQRTYARSAGKMTVTIELRDAASGVLIGRLIDFEQTREYQEPKLVNQVTNLEDFRIGFANAARYAREAINVAKTERPKP